MSLIDTVIRVENLGKSYRLGGSKPLVHHLQRGMQRFFDPRRWFEAAPPATEPFWALQDVSFEIKRGDVVGIIGRNGAGKSTLLKILSRITAPTTGRAVIHGRVGSLLEVGTGFHPELSGRENIFMNGVTLGLKHAEIRWRFDEIVAFSELEQFIDTPVKHYSSGMYMRLAFAVAAHLMAEVMIIDEVLAVGDAAFQKKCLAKMENVSHQGRTVLFVSHSMPAVLSLCKRGLLLEGGRLTMDDTISAVAQHYMGQDESKRVTRLSFPEDPALRAQILEARLLDPTAGSDGEYVPFQCTYRMRQDLADLILCLDVKNSAGISVYYANDDSLNETGKRCTGVHTVTCLIPKYLLAPGDYYVLFGFWQPGHAPEHFPSESLGFARAAEVNRLSLHRIDWPSIIYQPSTWRYESQKNTTL